jgi:hypothetical protein
MSNESAAQPKSDSAQTAPNFLKPQEGLAALHLFYTVDLGAWQELSGKEKELAKIALSDLVLTARQEPQTQVVTLSMLAKADIAPNQRDRKAAEQ